MRCKPCVVLLCEQEKNILHNGNISFDDVVEIARIMRDRSCARELKGTVRAAVASQGPLRHMPWLTPA